VEEPRLLQLPDGRTLAFDDLGPPEATPVVYLHGTPDSRLARHPDDALTASTGARLIPIDRPGAGRSDRNPGASLTALGDDLERLLDHLVVERAALLGWSAGGLAALGAAAARGERVSAVALVGTLPPVEAHADDALVSALGPARRPFVELAREVPAEELAAELAPNLVPQPLTAGLALEHVLEAAGEGGRRELHAVRGAAEQMALSLQECVRAGMGGLEDDIVLQLQPGLDLSRVTAPVRTIHGSADLTSPPEVGAWLVAHLARGVREVVPDAGHQLLLPHWVRILEALVADATDHGSAPAPC
jgi:pimeloyl-ACP methyl ester carboxylesterase